MPLQGIKNRLFSVVELFKPVNFINSTISGNRNIDIIIPISYNINQETYNNINEILFFCIGTTTVEFQWFIRKDTNCYL